MKNLTSIFVICFILSCLNKKREEVHIKYVNLDSFTAINVDCNTFEDYFETDVKSKILINHEAKEYHIQIADFIKRAKVYQTGVPDVRVIINFSSSPMDTLCIGNNLVSYRGFIYENDEGFRTFLEKTLK